MELVALGIAALPPQAVLVADLVCEGGQGPLELLLLGLKLCEWGMGWDGGGGAGYIEAC